MMEAASPADPAPREPEGAANPGERINARHRVLGPLTRDEKPALPQPPWVWGPSEVNEWIHAAYPSKGRRTHTAREGPEVIPLLRIVVDEPKADRVRTLTAEALRSIGLELSESPKSQGKHRVTGGFRRSLVGERTHVSLRFEPPIHVSSCKRLLDRLGGNLRIHALSVREAQARLPPRARR